MVLARMINWWMPCSFLLRLKGPKVFLFVSQARKIVCHGLNAEPGLTLSDQKYQLFCEVKATGAPSGSTDEGVKRF